ncbi:S41 family peptidase [Pedobacter sp. MC2016-05]|uniref:S41 family peptidase n=1 Tax=Pedobacter sp. MC2016-05 TaxID=2994474 RepID=UPI0022476F79|nr:S41 family peptidase [Pedobacter sp. MC2016-05]MCX2477245.1 S41 family peptidase [Pedobacter sp. MC2016-05]
MFDKPIYIISSKNTFSAAEYFGLTAKEMKRAIILGETTAGAGNPGTSQGYHSPNTDTVFWLFIPNCQIITRSGNSIEGVGLTQMWCLKVTTG